MSWIPWLEGFPNFEVWHEAFKGDLDIIDRHPEMLRWHARAATWEEAYKTPYNTPQDPYPQHLRTPDVPSAAFYTPAPNLACQAPTQMTSNAPRVPGTAVPQSRHAPRLQPNQRLRSNRHTATPRPNASRRAAVSHAPKQPQVQNTPKGTAPSQVRNRSQGQSKSKGQRRAPPKNALQHPPPSVSLEGQQSTVSRKRSASPTWTDVKRRKLE